VKGLKGYIGENTLKDNYLILLMEETQVVQNSDYLAKSNVEWVKDIQYQEPNQYEKDMLKGTLTPEQLLEGEITEEKRQLIKLNDIKVKIKVVALNTMGESPIQNTSLFSSLKKKTLLDTMNSIYENVYLVDEDKLTEMFNVVCATKVFGDNADYTSYPIYA
jgi:hypothetical protein